MENKSGLKFFQRYLKTAPLSHALWRSIEAKELAKYKISRPILDIGCGFGEFAGIFFTSQIEVGIDINEGEILKAAATGKYKKTLIADARKLPFRNNSFKSVISISTLEHIPRNEFVFKEAYRVLKAGGLFIFSVPTDKLFSGLLIVKILTFLKLRKIALLYYRLLNKAFKHVFIPTEKAWLQRAQKAGFSIQISTGTIPKSTLILWEIFLLSAIPSQLSKIIFGKRFTIATGLKIKFFKPFSKFIYSDPNFRANIIVVAKKPEFS